MDQLKPKDMAAISGLDEGFIKKCIKRDFLQPIHFTGTQEPLKSKTGKIIENRGLIKGGPKKILEVKKAREEGIPVEIEKEHLSAEQVFKNFWKLPRGKTRMNDPRFRREVQNMEDGNPIWWQGKEIVFASTPQYRDGYDAVEWDKPEAKRGRPKA